MKNQYYVYILSSLNRAIYIGVTRDLERRVYEHKNKLVEGHTKKYNVLKLVYFELGGDILAAIEREKQLKKWGRNKKLALVSSVNPEWKDLSADWFK